MNDRLYRSLDDRVLAGVAGGMAETYNLDPALVRLVWALLIVFTGGAFLIIYVILALVVPVRPYGLQPPPPGVAASPGGTTLGGTATSPNADQGSKSAPPAGPPYEPYPAYPRRRGDGTGPIVIGILLVLVGGYLLLRQFFPLFEIGRFWPVIVILIGLVLIVTAFGRRPR